MKIATIKTGLASLAMLPGLVMAAPAVADKADNAFMMICTALVLFMTIPGDCPVLRWVDSRQKRAVDADAGDGDVCTGLYSLGGLRLLAGVW